MDLHNLWVLGKQPIKPVARRRYVSGVRECAVHVNHDPEPIWLTEWYEFPQHLQVMTLGEVKDTRTTWLCPVGEQRVMELVERGLRGISLGPEEELARYGLEVDLASLAFRRNAAALEKLESLRATGPWAVHPNSWRCPECGGGMKLAAPGGEHVWSHRCEGRSTSYVLPQEGT